MAKWKAGAIGLSRGGGLANALATHPDVEITALCDLDQELLAAKGAELRVPDDVVRAVDFTIPGILAHEAAMAGGIWIDVPLF